MDDAADQVLAVAGPGLANSPCQRHPKLDQELVDKPTPQHRNALPVGLR